MQFAFQSFSPRSRPLSYDALQAREGCEPESGNDYFGVLAFTRICIFRHDPADYNFTQPDTVSYSLGPQNKGSGLKPFLDTWTAWVATLGIRVGKLGSVTPPANSDGEASGLYPATVPAKVTHTFDRDGLLAIAIQKTEAVIELRYYTDTAGTIATVSWQGYSPVLFYSGELARNTPAQGTTVCYYLKAASPGVIFARFGDEAYATERTVMPDLRTAPARLIEAAVGADRKANLRFIDALGRDCTLYSPTYPVSAQESATTATSFADGRVFAAAVTAPNQADAGLLAISFATGLVFAATVETANQRDDGVATLAIGFEDGSVNS